MTTGARQPATTRDDRILVVARILAAVVIVILAFAWVTLFLYPDQTDHRFAWTIHADDDGDADGRRLRLGGVLLRAVARRPAVASLRAGPAADHGLHVDLAQGDRAHWDRFHHGTFPFLLWRWVYLITPIACPPCGW